MQAAMTELFDESLFEQYKNYLDNYDLTVEDSGVSVTVSSSSSPTEA